MACSSTTSDSSVPKQTVRIGKTPKKRTKRKVNGAYMISRKNCFGFVEKLDPLSVDEALDGEATLNEQLDAFLNGVAKSAITRSMKAVTPTDILERSRAVTPKPKNRAVTQPKLKKVER